MKIFSRIIPTPQQAAAMVLAAVCAAGLAGCGGDSDTREPPVGPDLQGKWTGIYRQTGGGSPTVTELTATIVQDGDAIIIRTSLTGSGARLTGSITEDGCLSLFDAFDGEIWTTYFDKATTEAVEIADFISPPEAGEDLPPLQVISLVR